MAVVPLALGTFKRSRGRYPEDRLVNRYFEKAPGPEPVMLLTRPGLTGIGQLGPGPCRGILRKSGSMNGDVLFLSGPDLFRLKPDGTGASFPGTIDGTGRVSMDASPSEVKIATGSALYSYDGVTLAAEAFPDGAGVVSIAYLSGFWLAVRAESQSCYVRLPGDASWQALSVVSSEFAPDKLVAVTVLGDEIWLIGEDTIETWVLSGQADPPIQRVSGRVYEHGCISPDTIAKGDSAIFWVSEDSSAGRVVYRADNGPKRISDHGIEERLSDADPASLRAFIFRIDGHEFYTLTIGGVGTFAYDVSTEQWCEFASHGRTNWRAHLGAHAPGGQLVLGDDETGALWTLNPSVAADDGGIMDRIVSGHVEVNGSQRVRCNRAMLDASVQPGGVPAEVRLSISDDGGATWFDCGLRSLGQAGSHDVRVWWNRLGTLRSPGRVFQLSETSPVVTRISGLEFE